MNCKFTIGMVLGLTAGAAAVACICNQPGSCPSKRFVQKAAQKIEDTAEDVMERFEM